MKKVKSVIFYFLLFIVTYKIKEGFAIKSYMYSYLADFIDYYLTFLLIVFGYSIFHTLKQIVTG